MNGNSPEKDSYKFKVIGLILPTITANTRPIDSSSPTSSLGRCAHIPLDHRAFLQWKSRWNSRRMSQRFASFGIGPLRNPHGSPFGNQVDVAEA
jgi:hypothetical protein